MFTLKRFLVFGILGPPLGSVMMFGVMLPLFSVAVGDKPQRPADIALLLVLLLPITYLNGIVPALLAAVADAMLAKRLRFPPRLAAMTLAGYLLGFLPIASSYVSGHVHGPYLLIFGLVGAVPAAICCWLAAERATAA